MANPPIRCGEASHAAKLTEKQVKRIKEDIRSGRVLREIASEVGVGYMAIYKIAVGETWSNGAGRLIPYRSCAIPPSKRDRLYAIKHKKGASNSKLARALNTSESTVARAMRDAHAILAARVHRMLLTSGSQEAAMERFHLTIGEAEGLVTYAATHKLPKRLESELDDE